MDSESPGCRGCVLIADAEPAQRGLLQADLMGAGWEVVIADAAQAALDVLRARQVNLIVLDLRLPDADGLALIGQCRSLQPSTPLVATASQPTVDVAVEAMRRGAADCIAKPFSTRKLMNRLDGLLSLAPSAAPVRLGRCVSAEPAVVATLDQARQLAAAALPLAICGPAGSGRRTLALAVQQESGMPGLTIDAAALSADQLRAQLDRLAGGTPQRTCVIVTEAQALRPAEQARLAAMVSGTPDKDGPYRFVMTLAARPGVLAAKGALDAGLADLLAVSVLPLPPLHARRSDIPLLAQDMLAQISPGGAPSISPAAMQALLRYDWPGNIRQLRLVLERAVRLSSGGAVEPRHLPILQAAGRESAQLGWPGATRIDLQRVVDELETHFIDAALRQTNGNQAKAAELLGIPRTTLRDKLAKYGFLRLPEAEPTAK